MRHYTRIEISDAALAERRAALPPLIFEELMALALAPKATEELHPEAFYKGLRLCALDGSCVPISNTPQVKARMTKAHSRRAKAAFAQVGLCVMVELGLRNPIAACIGTKKESEMSLAQPLVDRLPERSLLIEDRYYGVPKELIRFRTVHSSGDRHVLARVRGNIGCRVMEVLHDGSALVEIGSGKKRLLVREIRGRVGRSEGKGSAVRLWTTLLDWRSSPAMELLELYGRRWEQEGFFRELKVDMRSAELVQSHTPETAAQELACYLLGYAMLVERRMEAAESAGVEVLRISFRMTLEVVRATWRTFELAGDMLDDAGKAKVMERAKERIKGQIVPARRKRSCPRAVRKPVGSWPRLRRNTYEKRPVIVALESITP